MVSIPNMESIQYHFLIAIFAEKVMWWCHSRLTFFLAFSLVYMTVNIQNSVLIQLQMTLLSNIPWQRFHRSTISVAESVPFIHFKLTAFQFHQLSPDFQEYVQTTEEQWKLTFTMSIIIQGGSVKVFFFFSLKRIIFMPLLGLRVFYLGRKENTKYIYHHPWRQCYSMYFLEPLYAQSIFST